MSQSPVKKAAIYFRANAPWRQARAQLHRAAARPGRGPLPTLVTPAAGLRPRRRRPTWPEPGRPRCRPRCHPRSGDPVARAGRRRQRRRLGRPDRGAHRRSSALRRVRSVLDRLPAPQRRFRQPDHDRRRYSSPTQIRPGPVPDSSAGAQRHDRTAVDDATSSPGVTTLPITELRAQHPDFDTLHLIKSDTDGLDVALVPAILEAWADSSPVAFFQFDPRSSHPQRTASTIRMRSGTSSLALGYTRAAVCKDNASSVLGADPNIARRAPRTLLYSTATSPDEISYYFWDVAVRRDDEPGHRRCCLRSPRPAGVRPHPLSSSPS